MKSLTQSMKTAVWFVAALASMSGLAGCKGKEDGSTAPPPAKVIEIPDMNLVKVDNPGQFRLVAAEKHESAPEFTATGAVFPDISREVPVISLANGRVVEIRARLGDNVKKGQLLLTVQSSDITNAFDTYLKAKNDELLAKKADTRAEDLYQHGAISEAVREQADDAEKNALADLTAAEEQLTTLGVDKSHPSSLVEVHAPITGVIVAQNVTQSGAAGVSLAGSASTFTVADLSTVWIVCDVYENDIPKLQLGQSAKIRIDAYPDKPISGRISDIGPVLDPSLRTAKVRLEVLNPGFLKLGMFATATFEGRTKETHTIVPANAILHLHDRDWVFLPTQDASFRRTEVKAGKMFEGNRQEIISGLNPGQQVVADALSLESAGSQ